MAAMIQETELAATGDYDSAAMPDRAFFGEQKLMCLVFVQLNAQSRAFKPTPPPPRVQMPGGSDWNVA